MYTCYIWCTTAPLCLILPKNKGLKVMEVSWNNEFLWWGSKFPPGSWLAIENCDRKENTYIAHPKWIVCIFWTRFVFLMKFGMIIRDSLANTHTKFHYNRLLRSKDTSNPSGGVKPEIRRHQLSNFVNLDKSKTASIQADYHLLLQVIAPKLLRLQCPSFVHR